MKKIERRGFLKVMGATGLVCAAGVLTGCGNKEKISRSVSTSAETASSTEIPSASESGSASDAQNAGTSEASDTENWKETELPVNGNIQTVNCELGGLSVWAEPGQITLYGDDLDTGEYVWHGEAILGLQISVSNEGTAEADIFSSDFSAAVDGTEVELQIEPDSVAAYGDMCMNFFREEDVRKIAAGESAGECVIFKIPTEEMYLSWQKMEITFHPQAVPDEKVTYTLQRGETLYDTTISAVKMVREA